jgi:hypothetical protein
MNWFDRWTVPKNALLDSPQLRIGFKCQRFERVTPTETFFTNKFHGSWNANRAQRFTATKCAGSDSNKLWSGFEWQFGKPSTITETTITHDFHGRRNANQLTQRVEGKWIYASFCDLWWNPKAQFATGRDLPGRLRHLVQSLNFRLSTVHWEIAQVNFLWDYLQIMIVA